MADDPHLREMTCDPKVPPRPDHGWPYGRWAGRMAKAFSDAGAAIVFVGLADPWKPFAGMAGLRKSNASKSCRST